MIGFDLGLCTCVCVAVKHHLLAVGDQSGTLHILEVPWTLRHPSSSEVSTMCFSKCYRP